MHLEKLELCDGAVRYRVNGTPTWELPCLPSVVSYTGSSTNAFSLEASYLGRAVVTRCVQFPIRRSLILCHLGLMLFLNQGYDHEDCIVTCVLFGHYTAHDRGNQDSC